MVERPCIRGCSVEGEHFAACRWYGLVADAEDRESSPWPRCRGCVPIPAREGALICDRCYRRLTGLLDDAPDVVGHLRSRADPMKAAVYDRVMVSSSRPELPAPVAADLLDASDDIMRTLRAWALYVQFPGQGWRAQGLEAGIDAADAFEDAQGCVQVILGDLDRLVNDSHQVGALCEGIMLQHPGIPDVWTVADAIARYPLDDRPRWADTACPECDMKTVRVRPPKFRGAEARYTCTTCDWSKTDRDDGGFWAEAFVALLPERESV